MTYYQRHLRSRGFSIQRQLCYYLAFKRCSICFQKYDLQPHHLSYKVVGKWYEFFFLRLVCSRCHKNVQTMLGRMTNNTLALIINYYLHRFPAIVFFIGRWIITSYWIPRRPRKRR